MFKKIRYLIGRAWLAGIFTWFLVGITANVIGIGVLLHAQSNLTPYSVNVRGYYRSDGTYVRPHTRRPPGSVKHDEPFESLRLVSFIIIIVGLVFSAFPIYKFIKVPDADLLPDIILENHLPPKPPDIIVPTNKAIAKKIWLCKGCSILISPGDLYYYYYGNYYNRYKTRVRFCVNCKNSLISKRNAVASEIEAYSKAVEEEERKRQKLRKKQYVRYYGIEPKEYML